MQDPTQVAGVRQLLGGLSSLLGSAAGPTTESAANETTNKRRLLQVAKNQEGFPGPFPFVDKSACIDEMDGEVDDAGAFCNAWYESANAAGNESTSDEGAESSTDDDATANSTMEDDKRQELIRFITANSDLKEDSLEHMGDQCLQNTHEMVAANAADDGSDGSDADGGDGGDDDSTDDDDDAGADDGDGGDDSGSGTSLDTVMDRLDDLEDRMVTADEIDEHVATAANQREKEERAERIVANSNEYDEDDVEWLADLPEKELDRKENSVGQTGGLPAAGGTGFPAPATGNTSGGSGTDEAEDMPDLEVN